MNVKAKQVTSLDPTRMDITSVLGYFGQIKSVISANTALTTAMGDVWTAFQNSLAAYDNAYAQSRKWLQTEELETLDKSRDGAVRGFLNALKAMTASPNATKEAAAKRILFVRDKYNIEPGDEYMKETTAVSQMIQDMEANCQADLALTGLDEWFTDMKTKNETFLAKMNERTDEQTGAVKGIVRETRLQVEAAYRDLMKLLNAMAICEYPAGLDFNAPIDRLNAEIEHYRQILARKGISTGTGNTGGGGQQSTDGGQQSGGGQQGGGQQGGETPVNPGGETPDPGTGGGTTPDPNPGGEEDQ